jgi:hypothetical protein
MVQETNRADLKPDNSSPYEIQIQGELDERWSEWFDGIKICVKPSKDHTLLTTIHLPAMDQTKLRGILNKIWDLNLNLVSVRQVHDSTTQKESTEGFADIKW